MYTADSLEHGQIRPKKYLVQYYKHVSNCESRQTSPDDTVHVSAVIHHSTLNPDNMFGGSTETTVPAARSRQDNVRYNSLAVLRHIIFCR